jgi:hypothetical protein
VELRQEIPDQNEEAAEEQVEGDVLPECTLLGAGIFLSLDQLLKLRNSQQFWMVTLNEVQQRLHALDGPLMLRVALPEAAKGPSN